MLLLAVTALCSVVQFPFSVPMYFCYVAPLLILSCAALGDPGSIRGHVPLTVPVAIFYLLFAALILLPNQIYRRGMSLQTTSVKAFTLPRAAGMKGDAVQVETYEQIVAEIARHAGTSPIWAGPDCAEFYFLAGRTNPTPVLWEALSGTDRDPHRILNWIEQRGSKSGGDQPHRANPVRTDADAAGERTTPEISLQQDDRCLRSAMDRGVSARSTLTGRKPYGAARLKGQLGGKFWSSDDEDPQRLKPK